MEKRGKLAAASLAFALLYVRKFNTKAEKVKDKSKKFWEQGHLLSWSSRGSRKAAALSPLE